MITVRDVTKQELYAKATIPVIGIVTAIEALPRKGHKKTTLFGVTLKEAMKLRDDLNKLILKVANDGL